MTLFGSDLVPKADYIALLNRVRELEAQNAALLADVNQDEGYERLKARCQKLEAALQLIGNELSLHADQGPAGEAFRALLVPTLETKGDAG